MFDDKGRLEVVIDTPKGSRAKYKLEAASDAPRLSKLLPRGMAFPCNFGFVPGTVGGDGDALDVLVLGDEPLICGCALSARLIGVIRATQVERDGREVENHRLLAVIDTDYNPPEVSDLAQLHPRVVEEIEQFFVAYNHAQGRSFTPRGRDGAQAAVAMVRRCAKA